MQPGLLQDGAPQDENVCSGGDLDDFLNGAENADTSFRSGFGIVASDALTCVPKVYFASRAHML